MDFIAVSDPGDHGNVGFDLLRTDHGMSYLCGHAGFRLCVCVCVCVYVCLCLLSSRFHSCKHFMCVSLDGFILRLWSGIYSFCAR
jgi:hypothetical protein